MSLQNSTWNRQVLYQKVWHFPLHKLAAEYGISGVDLARVSCKLEIPGLGHWTKIVCGHNILRPSLPRNETRGGFDPEIREPETPVLTEDTPELEKNRPSCYRRDSFCNKGHVGSSAH